MTGELGRSIKQIAREPSVVDLQASPHFSPIIHPVPRVHAAGDWWLMKWWDDDSGIYLQTASMSRRRLLLSDQQVFLHIFHETMKACNHCVCSSLEDRGK